MKGAFTCPHCFTQNACDCESCKPFIKEGEYVNKWDKTGSYHICGKCGMSYSPDESLDAEYKLNQKEMTKPFIIANVREIIDCWEHFDPEGYSFSKMVELLNEKAAEYYNQELAKERERYDKLYSEFNEVCRQVQINKDRCGRYEEAYHAECKRSAKLVEALNFISDITTSSVIRIKIKQSLSEYKSK